MIEQREPLFNKEQTAKAIKNLVKNYSGDLSEVFVTNGKQNTRLTDLTLLQFFNFVKNIPYRQDPKPVEVISRPEHILRFRALGMDCKKKTILVASYLTEKNIPVRYIGMSNRPDGMVHHIFPQGLINGQWMNLDATYKHYKPFEVKQATKAVLL